MNFEELRKSIKQKIEHPSCKRCGKQFYLPQPPKQLYESWGIMAWTAFVKQFAKRKGWHEVNSLSKNLVCTDCSLASDVNDNIILQSFDTWVVKYNQWLKENNLYEEVYKEEMK